jgi:hypothetical protein
VRPGRVAPNSPAADVQRNTARILAGNISFGQNNTDPAKNVFGWHAQNVVTPSTANTEFAVPHGLTFSAGGPAVPYKPVRFRVTNINANATVYASSTAWTTSNIYLKCSAASVTISLFID